MPSFFGEIYFMGNQVTACERELVSPLDVDVVGTVPLCDVGVLPRGDHARPEHFPARLRDHGPVVDAETHVGPEQLGAPLLAHHAHHLLQSVNQVG